MDTEGTSAKGRNVYSSDGWLFVPSLFPRSVPFFETPRSTPPPGPPHPGPLPGGARATALTPRDSRLARRGPALSPSPRRGEGARRADEGGTCARRTGHHPARLGGVQRGLSFFPPRSVSFFHPVPSLFPAPFGRARIGVRQAIGRSVTVWRRHGQCSPGALLRPPLATGRCRAGRERDHGGRENECEFRSELDFPGCVQSHECPINTRLIGQERGNRKVSRSSRASIEVKLGPSSSSRPTIDYRALHPEAGFKPSRISLPELQT